MAKKPYRFMQAGADYKGRVGYASGGSGGGFVGSVKRAAKAAYRAVPTFPDDHYRNQLQRAEGGLPVNTRGLNARQLAAVKKAAKKGR